MTSRIILIAALLFALVWLLLFADWSDEPPDETRVVAAWGSEKPPYVIHEDMFTTTTTARARTAPRRVYGSSAGAPAVVETESSLNGYPCGAVHDLPPCWVMRRESGGNPNAYNPTGCSGYGCYGLWQFSGEWRCHFGLSCDIAAWTPEEQTHAARTLWNHGAGCRNWAACGSR